ncbi:MAG: hypothetical protein LBQ52_01470 [Helicobacteraceae bacterium]|jgi:hypothetical protein|nr:hypothetical protein [Helicobacteraceae bacterium]
MFFAWQGRGKFVGIPAFMGLFGAAATELICDFIEAQNSSVYTAATWSAGLFIGAIILYRLDRGAKAPNITDTEPKEPHKDTAYWIPIRHWAVFWLVLSAICLLYAIKKL